MSDMTHAFAGEPTGFVRGGAQSALSALGGGRGGFFRDRRFASAADRVEMDIAPPPVPEDPVARAWNEGHAAGAAEARATFAADIAAQDAARHRIELSLMRMDAGMIDQLQERLRETVLALCEDALRPAAIDPAGLSRRVAAAAAMLARADDDRVIRLHPDDLALVRESLPADWAFEPDPTLERGAVRVEGAHGGVEDGPEQWRQALVEALNAC